MEPPLRLLDDFLSNSDKDYQSAIRDSFDHIYEFMRNSQDEGERILENRIDKGEITDASQAKKSIAGHMFSNMMRYIFIKNKEAGNIFGSIFIATKAIAVKKLGEDLVVHIGEETQNPDCDIIIYNEETKKIIILSLKTSLKERAGQTIKWKLLLEIATSKNEIKKKYDISYHGRQMPIVCFGTVNFYNEINQPQQRGLLKLFDASFIAKTNVKSDIVISMSELPNFVNENLG